MKKTGLIALSAALAMGAAATASAEFEYSGSIKNESSWFTMDGPQVGQRNTMTDNSKTDSGEMMKFENSLNLFLNNKFSDQLSAHGQLKLVYDSEAQDPYKDHMDYSQYDYLRELYVDYRANGWDVRLGKQQVVWGRADGIKLLDVVNPTDWREFVQNTMEDSRIPVWMLNVEKDLGDKGDLQFLVAQHEESKIPGLSKESQSGHPFIMKGVESITGRRNGFLNLVPALGAVSNTFWGAFGGGGNLAGSTNMTVQNYVTANGAAALNTNAQMTNMNRTNLIDGSNWDTNNPNSVFEYMSNATFATFDAFVNAQSEYRRDYPDELDPNLGLRYRNSAWGDFNYSVNYLWAYDPNPYVDMHWEGANGEKLRVVEEVNGGLTTLRLRDSRNNAYGGSTGRKATLVFTEKLNRVHNYGFSFDKSLEPKFLSNSMVLRGEFLYQQDTKTPVIDRTKLGYGDLVGGMKMEKADMLKYVVGADFTFFTNLMVSPQFIQFINLDYVDQAAAGGSNSGRYTADAATLHMSNNLQKAEENKEFYSLFLSKPFGAEQQGRVNNIFMIEENGGYWNRVDMEYNFTDEVVGTTEFNAYFGDDETMFGQFNKASNIQVGMKYLF